MMNTGPMSIVIINRFFPCSYTLSIKYSDITNICQYCHQQSDTLVHYFVYCTDVAMFWKQFGKMWKRIVEFWFPLSELDVLFLASKMRYVMRS